MSGILAKLSGGDLRSIGRVDEVVSDVLAEPALFDELFYGMLNDDPLIRMRSADAVEKITQQHPEYLQPYKSILIEQVAQIPQQEVRWHVAQLFPRLEADDRERAMMVAILVGYLEDKSKIVKTFSMQALSDFAEKDASLRPKVSELLESLVQSGSPAMKNRGRKLLVKLRKVGD